MDGAMGNVSVFSLVNLRWRYRTGDLGV